MKKTLFLATMLTICAALLAHPASDVVVTADLGGKTIDVNYKHKVGNTSDHFIQDVQLKLNGKLVVTQSISIQDSENGGTVKYKLPELKKGDKIEAATKCNKGGSKSGSLDI